MKTLEQKLTAVPSGSYRLRDLAKIINETVSPQLGKALFRLRGKIIGQNSFDISASGRFREFIFLPNVRGIVA